MHHQMKTIRCDDYHQLSSYQIKSHYLVLMISVDILSDGISSCAHVKGLPKNHIKIQQ